MGTDGGLGRRFLLEDVPLARGFGDIVEEYRLGQGRAMDKDMRAALASQKARHYAEVMDALACIIGSIEQRHLSRQEILQNLASRPWRDQEHGGGMHVDFIWRGEHILRSSEGALDLSGNHPRLIAQFSVPPRYAPIINARIAVH